MDHRKCRETRTRDTVESEQSKSEFLAVDGSQRSLVSRSCTWLGIVAYAEDVMSRWLRRARLVNAGRVVEHHLGRLHESNLFECIVENLELLHGQVTVHFDHDTLDTNTRRRRSRRINHEGSAVKALRPRVDMLVLLPGSSVEQWKLLGLSKLFGH